MEEVMGMLQKDKFTHSDGEIHWSTNLVEITMTSLFLGSGNI